MIDEPEDVTQNILFMFNIHHYRREWELFPTALKLEQLIKATGTDQESVLTSFTELPTVFGEFFFRGSKRNL